MSESKNAVKAVADAVNALNAQISAAKKLGINFHIVSMHNEKVAGGADKEYGCWDTCKMGDITACSFRQVRNF